MDDAKQIFEDNSRQYGNGLQKFEPNDINKGKMLDLDIMDETSKKEILTLYKQYRHDILDNKNGEHFINLINDILIEVYT